MAGLAAAVAWRAPPLAGPLALSWAALRALRLAAPASEARAWPHLERRRWLWASHAGVAGAAQRWQVAASAWRGWRAAQALKLALRCWRAWRQAVARYPSECLQLAYL